MNVVDVGVSDVSWPPLPLEGWRATKETLHRYCQMIGKVRLALHPFRNHWWHVTLRLDTTGLTTGPMPVGDGRLAEVRLDLVDHLCEVRDSAAEQVRFSLQPDLPCADSHSQLFGALATLGIRADIDRAPTTSTGRRSTSTGSTAPTTPRRSTATGRSSPPARWRWRSSPAGSTARRAPCTCSGTPSTSPTPASRAAVPRSGRAPAWSRARRTRTVIAFGFWPGDDTVPYPAYYSHTAPAPDGLVDAPLEPAEAVWDADAGTAVLAYDVVRAAADPRSVLLAFWQSAYLAGARTAGWDAADLATRVAPAAAAAPGEGHPR